MKKIQELDEQTMREALHGYARHSVPTTDVTLAVHRRMLARQSLSSVRRWLPAAAIACAVAMIAIVFGAWPALRRSASSAFITLTAPRQAATSMPTVTVAATASTTVTPTVAPPQPIVGKELWRIGRGAAWGAQYSPDGKRIAVQASTGIYLYDSATLSETGMIPALGWDSNTQWSNDSARLATFEQESGQVNIWDAATAQRTLVITEGIHSYSTFSFNGNLIAISNGPSPVVVRDAKTGVITYRPVFSNSFYGNPFVFEVELSRDGQRLALHNVDGRVLVFALAGGAATQLFEFNLPPPVATNSQVLIAFSPDGKLLAAPSEGGVTVYDATTGQTIRELAETKWFSLQRLIYSQDGRWLIGLVIMPAPRRELKTLVWDASTGRSVTIVDPFWASTSRAFSPDGHWRLESLESQINIRPSTSITDSAVTTRTITGFRDGIRSLALGASATGDDLILTTSQGHEVFDAASGAPKHAMVSQIGNGDPLDVRLSPDSRSLVAVSFGSFENTTNVYDYAHGKWLGRVENCPSSRPTTLNIVQLPLTLFVTNTLLACVTDKAVNIIDVATQQPRASIPVTGVLALAASHDGRRIAVSARGQPVMIYDSETGWLATTISNTKSSDVTTMQWLPGDAQLVAIGNSGGIDIGIDVWDAKTGKLIRCCISESTLNNVAAASALSPDGRLLAVAYYPTGDQNANPDNIIRLWDPVTGQSRGTLKGHASFVSSLQFSHDGTRLFSGGNDGTVRAWQLFDAPKTELKILDVSADHGFSSNEIRIISGIRNDGDKPIKLTLKDIAFISSADQALAIKTSLPSLPTTIAPGATLNVQWTFAAPTDRSDAATLRIFDQSFRVNLP